MIAMYERAGRRLMEHHRKLRGSVGTKLDGVELVLFETFCDLTCRRYTVLRVAVPHPALAARAREIAAGVLGKAVLGGEAREITIDWRTFVYAVPLDGVAVFDLGGEIPGWAGQSAAAFVRRPDWVRYFDGRALAAGIGQQDGGTMAGRGLRLLRAE